MVLGIVFVSPDSVCITFLVEAGTDPFCILTWKMIGVLVMVGVCAHLLSSGLKATLSDVYGLRYHATPVIVLQVAVDISFTIALVYTSAANTLLFVSLNPMWAALFGYFFLKEKLPLRTIAALVSAIVSVALIFVPEIAGEAAHGRNSNSTMGDCLALATGFMLAMYITFIRHAGSKRPEANMTFFSVGASALAAAVSAAVAGPSVWPRAAGFDAARPLWQFFCVVFADSFCLTCLFVALNLGPALISGPEVGLIMLLEVILGPFWVFVAYGVVPGLWTFIGGSLLLSTLALHELHALCRADSRDAIVLDIKSAEYDEAELAVADSVIAV